MSFPFNYGMSIYMPPGPDMDRVDKAWDSLGSLLESRQNDKDTNSVAQMAAERMRALGPQGEQWAKMIQSNPRAALASMEQYGGPMEIENQILGARAQGEASRAIGEMQQSEASPQEIVGYILRTQGPKAAQAAAAALGTNSTVSPKAVMGPDGQPVYVSAADAIGRQPVPRAPLVSIGGDGLNPYQTAQTRAGYLDDHRTESEPYVGALSRLNELDGILADLDGEPTPFQSEAAATAFAKGLKPAEAVMRDDIARILGQGFENQLKGFLNLPQKASRAQIQQMRDALSQVVSVAEMRQRGIDAKYRALGSDYQVEIPGTAVPTPRQAAGKPRPPTMDDLMSMSPGETFVDSEGITVRKTDRVDANGEPIFEDVD